MQNKKENFKRIASNRVEKIEDLFRQLGNLTNTSFYEYSEEDVEKIFKDLEASLKKTKKRLIDSNERKKKSNKVEL